METTARRRVAALGLAAAVVSAFSIAGPAQAAAPATTRTVGSTSTPTVAIGGVAKVKAVVKPVVGAGAPTGNVTFKEGATVLGTTPLVLVGTAETAKLNLTGLAIGVHQIIATYAGSPTFATSTSLPIIITVTKVATTTVASSTTPAVIPGQSIKLKAVIKVPLLTGTPTGVVTFSEGATVLGSSTVTAAGVLYSGKLTLPSLPLGVHTIIATYSGSATFAASTSDPLTISVDKPSTLTTLTVNAGAVPGDYNLSVVVTVVLPGTGIPSGNVVYLIDGNAPQTVALNANGRAVVSLSTIVGTSHTVTVNYLGNGTYGASTVTTTFLA